MIMASILTLDVLLLQLLLFVVEGWREFKYIKQREKFRCFLFYHITSNLKLQTIT